MIGILDKKQLILKDLHLSTRQKNLMLNTNGGVFFYKPEEIVRLEASSNYTHIYFTDKKKIIVPKVMKDFVKILEPLGFVRTHRSHLVNRAYIVSISAKGGVTMKDSSVAEVSRRKKSSVLMALKS